METRIFGIGRGRYKFNRRTLNAFVEESKHHAPEGQRDDNGQPDAADPAKDLDEKELHCIFDEIMGLYHDYMRSESVDLLIKLKCKLEEVSIRYQSHVLASEVLNINSCLPYECRITARKEPSL